MVGGTVDDNVRLGPLGGISQRLVIGAIVDDVIDLRLAWGLEPMRASTESCDVVSVIEQLRDGVATDEASAANNERV